MSQNEQEQFLFGHPLGKLLNKTLIVGGNKWELDHPTLCLLVSCQRLVNAGRMKDLHEVTVSFMGWGGSERISTDLPASEALTMVRTALEQQIANR